MSDRDPKHWRSRNELAGSEEFRESLEHEFPWRTSEEVEGVSRREFWRLMGGSTALAGLSGCVRQPLEKIVPYVNQPEEIVPGKPLFFATAMPAPGGAIGLLVESHEGRPTKIEGNPRHPASLGATDAFAQASVLTLYDPDRSQAVLYADRISNWLTFLASFERELAGHRADQGARLRLLTETVTSPTLAAQIRALLEAFPRAKWHQYEPAGRDNARAGARLAFGEPVNTVYHLDKARVILALDADFLFCGAGNVRYAREFAAGRRPGAGEMNRLYAVEAMPSSTGAMADHRLALKAGEIEGFTRALAGALGLAPEFAADLQRIPSRGQDPRWLQALARDLQAHRGASLVVAGDGQPHMVHALAHAMNHTLGNSGSTVVWTDPVEPNPVDEAQSLAELAADMKAGRVEMLVMLGGNPVYTAPADLRFAELLAKIKYRAHLSLYEDETSALCHWHVPETHYLEAWSDTRAYDGTTSIVQPLIAPLYGGKSAHEIVAAMLGRAGQSGYEIVRQYWRGREPLAKDFDRAWDRALHAGLIAGTAAPARALTPKKDFLAQPRRPAGAGIEIVFRPDPTVGDGRFANNGWLQELPKPVTKLTWDNAALMSPATARRLAVESEDLVELRYQGRTLRDVPVWITPGHADESVTLHLGYGRTRAGKTGSGAGVNAYLLRTSAEPWNGAGVEIYPQRAKRRLACTQDHAAMEGRHLVRVATLERFRKEPDFARKIEPEPAKDFTLYPNYSYEGYAWGMAIDLNACVGCNACVVACQAENNIPVVGQGQVVRGREMHWITVDRYFEGDEQNPRTYFQPRLCMHCENAPCEVVCPVGATVHSPEGLNEMVYNRCVGTRYCSNNCPYKVRHFNFLLYSDFATQSLKLQRNPNVSVRSRGVMEKCTYCVQRINAAKIQAEIEDRPVRDGEIRTACQAACPAEAIVFGDINDPKSRVAQLKREPRNYGLLVELNTRPRTTYLARLRNPNPELEPERAEGHGA